MREDTIQEERSNLSLPGYSAVIIANPKAGSYSQQIYHLNEMLKFLRQRGWRVELVLTEFAGGARQLARAAVEQQADVVIAAGGDGTINEIIQELAGSETALGVLPFGTVNVWAREVGIPLDHQGARDVLIHGQTRRIDLGCVNNRYFLLMAGIGFDGEVARAVEKKSFKHLKILSYLLVGTWLGLGYPGFRALLHLNKRTMRTRALQITIGNTQLYGGAVKFTWHAKIDDGLLDICIVRRRGMLGRIVVALDFLLRRKQRSHWVSYETCTSIHVHTRKPIAIQTDGDPAGYTPATFSVMPGVLKVIIPEKAPSDLFSRS